MFDVVFPFVATACYTFIAGMYFTDIVRGEKYSWLPFGVFMTAAGIVLYVAIKSLSSLTG